MRSSLVLLCLALACLATTQAASYRRGDKISEHFKQLDLPPEEIDPNVAPLDSMKDEIFDNEVIDEAEEQAAAAVATEDEVIEEAVQSIATTVAPVAVTSAAPVAAAAAEATSAPVKAEEDVSPLAKYCKCSGNHCDCCRNFNLPFIPVKGPGCARMSYLGNEKMAVSLKYGDLTLITRTVSSKRARPICVGLPGGYSQFCGRVYGLSKASEDFKACLGFELRADDEVEAALRVSCFKFGPDGLKVAEAEPLPSEAVKQEDDDDDDIFGFAAGGDDEEEDDYDEENDEDEEEDDDEEADTDYADDDADAEEAPAEADYGGFSLAGLLDELDDDDEDETKPSATPAAAAAPATAAPVEATRTVESVQSKDDKGTEATEGVDMLDEVAAAAASLVDDVVPATETTADTTVKAKKSKKSKKNKKKKAADGQSDFAYDLLNGLLDFFN